MARKKTQPQQPEQQQPPHEETAPPSPTAQRPARWRLFVLAAMIVLFVAGSIALWRQFGRTIVAADEQYLVGIDGLEITPQPPWIRSDVRAEVFYDAGWDKQRPSILETDLTLRVAQAFEQHTWVAKVAQVTKHHPARVVVVLKYRRPAAMVEVDYQGQPGLLPVDGSGVLLPPENFTVEEAADYLRIAVDYSGPRGSVGTSWGDGRVAGAAAIAELLLDDWQPWGLHRVVSVQASRLSAQAPAEYELHTRGKTRILWGRSPGSEAVGEALARQKQMRLAQLAAGEGGLDEQAAERVIDLRDPQRISLRPR